MEKALDKNKPNKEEKSSHSKGNTSFYEIMECANKFIQSGDLKSASLYVNLAKLLKVSDLSSKVTIITLDSIIKFKSKNQNELLRITRKVLKLLNKNVTNLFSPQLYTLFIKIIFKTAQACEDLENSLIPCWLYYLCLNLYNNQEIQKEDSTYAIIKTKIPIFLKRITENLTIINNQLLEKKSSLRTIQNIFHNKTISISLNKPNESYYLVSHNWITNMIMFIESYLDEDKENDDTVLFNTNNVCILFFSNEEDEEYRKEIVGTYPGNINNFSLIKPAEFWQDPLDTFSNVYLDKNIKENKDYLILTKDIYSNVTNCFGVFNEIQRKTVFNEESLEIEIHLKSLKVLFINEYLRDNLKDLICIKYIQISKFATFNSFEDKIRRIFLNLLPKDLTDAELEYDFKLFIFKQDIREMVQLILEFSNKNKFFKTNSKELKKSDFINKNLSDLQLDDDSILIVEAIPKNMIVKPFIRIKIESANCTFCNLAIKEKKIYCNDCSQNVYCSDICKSSDTSHNAYHQNLLIMIKANLSIDEISHIKISTFLQSNSKGGLTGLKNIDGTSSFMNSALTCLSHCEDLTKYFLSKSFLEDISNNMHGIEGKVAIVYYELMKELWQGSNSVVSPWDIRNIAMSFRKQFSVASQDSMEMVLFILNRLHEDLSHNQNIKLRLNQEMDSDDNSKDSWITSFKKKTNSIIFDLFLGSLKKTYLCAKCNNTEAFYEAFLHLPLNIPETKNNKVRFKVFPNNFEFHYFYVEIFELSKKTTVKDIKKKIKNHQHNRKKEFDAVLFKNKTIECVLSDNDTIYDYIYTKIDFADEEFIDYEILFYEVENSYQSKNKGDFVTFYVTPSLFFEENYYYFYKNTLHKALNYPKAFSISKKSRVKDLFIEVYKYYRRIMDDKIIKVDESRMDTTYYKNFYENINNDEFIEKDFDKNYLKIDSSNENEQTDCNNLNQNDNNSLKKNEKLFELFFFNNIPQPQSLFSFKPSCEFCKKKCGHCKINFSLNSSIYELYATQQITREFLLLADFSRFKDNCHKFYDEFYDLNDPRNSPKGDFTIYDCLDNLTNEEIIVKEKEKEMEWNCEVCKSKKAEAYKKVEINSLPKCLIIQLKRFKLRGYTSLIELVNNKKKEDFVDFPINNLDLTNFLDDPSTSGKLIYELFAISRHTGNIKSGSFTCVVNNQGQWHEINDDIVVKADLSEIVDPRAYLLFYRRVDDKNLEFNIENNSINNIPYSK